MSEHDKKKIAPIVITVLLIIYYFIYFFVLMSVVKGVFKILLGIIPFLFAVLMIWICVQRLREIDKGEEDDLSKY